MRKQKTISQRLEEIILAHEKELRENYKKMLARFEQLRKGMVNFSGF
ncbi:hypothetical protein K9N08_02730 [Candidatus Gracilibacteria bacterium]|nr:hypothetical protein [Candidatus Gracilibacteria bacterium]MCF7896557.1 hypothetical protein [Candidatus Gracilibacteria bacterium]